MEILIYSPSKDGDENIGGTWNCTMPWANLCDLELWTNFEEDDGLGDLQRAVLVWIILWLDDSVAGWINMLIVAHTKSSINWPNL